SHLRSRIRQQITPRLRPFHLNSGRHNLSDFIEKTASFCPLFSFVSRLSRSIIKTDQHNH
ncbi:MAG: hypothetical protein RSC68_17125, partial [Acinetobacter sp.]